MRRFIKTNGPLLHSMKIFKFGAKITLTDISHGLLHKCNWTKQIIKDKHSFKVPVLFSLPTLKLNIVPNVPRKYHSYDKRR